MKDEIKEILDKLRETANYPKLNYSSYDKSYNETIDNVAMIKSFACKQLLDYITNLQQIEQDHQKLNGELRKENKKLQEENEKAMKLLKEFYDSVNYDEIIALLEKYEQFKGLKEGK